MAAPLTAATAVSALGTLGDGVVGSGGPTGRVHLERAGIEIDWWIGADDGWKIAPGAGATSGKHGAQKDEAHADATVEAATVNTIRPGVAPAIEARVRVPSGEMVLRAYAVAHAGVPFVVVDLENASPAAAVVAWVVRAAPGYRIGRVALQGTTLLIDARARIELPRVPSRWAVESRAVGVSESVLGGGAATGPFEPVTTRRGDLEIALLFPIAHRTRTRLAAAPAMASEPVPVAQLPALADVERGWIAALERGTGVDLPDETMQAAVEAARATLLLGAVGDDGRDRTITTESVAWGLGSGRLRRSKGTTDDPWPRLKATVGASGSSPHAAAAWLRGMRAALVGVTRDGVDLLPYFPHDWLGQPVAVHELVTRHGPVSFALRWHGARPALLWEVPEGVALRAPAIDGSWTGRGGAGEALLAEIDPTKLLPLRAGAVSDPGVIIDEPGSFT